MSQEILLEKLEFDFIDALFKKYGIVEGRGYKKIAEILLNELKISEKYYLEKFAEYGGLERDQEYFIEKVSNK